MLKLEMEEDEEDIYAPDEGIAGAIKSEGPVKDEQMSDHHGDVEEEDGDEDEDESDSVYWSNLV